jgi:hypothetical protein
MKPEPRFFSQELHILLKMIEKILAAPQPPADLSVEESSDLKEKPEPGYDNGVIDDEPETLHRSTSCCARGEEGR